MPGRDFGDIRIYFRRVVLRSMMPIFDISSRDAREAPVDRC
jgi:hypothetical protein